MKIKLLGLILLKVLLISTKKDHNKVFKKDFSNTDFSFLKELISVNKSNDIIKHIEKVILVKGDAVKTIPKFCKSNKALIVKLLYLDCPIYKPTITALKILSFNA